MTICAEARATSNGQPSGDAEGTWCHPATDSGQQPTAVSDTVGVNWNVWSRDGTGPGAVVVTLYTEEQAAVMPDGQAVPGE